MPVIELSLQAPLSFDLMARSFKEDPYPTLRAMREAGPVIPYSMPIVGRIWLTTTHASCEAMLKDNRRFVQEGRNAGGSGFPGQQWWMPRSFRLLADNMLLKDEPDHRRLRKLVNRAFARRDIQAMRGRIEEVADGYLDEIAGVEEIDLVAVLSRRLPLAVIAELLGLPNEQRNGFLRMARGFSNMTSPWDLMRAIGGINSLVRLLDQAIEAQRRAPQGGIIAELIAAEEDGDRLSKNELLAMVIILLVAGSETTTHLISNAVIALERNPAQKAWLLADLPARLERAVEELARQTTPVQATKPRFVAEDGQFFGQSLRKGELVMALLASANADPAAFEAPETLRLDRFPNPHLVFGSGIHFCLGMQLARVETQTAIARLYQRYPGLSIADDGLEWAKRIGMRGVKRLRLRLGERAVAPGRVAGSSAPHSTQRQSAA
jgi:cytochrome P450